MKVIIRFSDNSGCVEFKTEHHNVDAYINSLKEINVGVKSIEYKEE